MTRIVFRGAVAGLLLALLGCAPSEQEMAREQKHLAAVHFMDSVLARDSMVAQKIWVTEHTHLDFKTQDCFPKDNWLNMLEHHHLDSFPKDQIFGRHNKLTPDEFATLSVPELISYYQHQEQPSQNCEWSDGCHLKSKMMINKFLQDPDPLAANSQRQLDALDLHRTEVISLIQACLDSTDLFTEGEMKIMIDLKAWELIPSLIHHYSKAPIKDSFMLTTLLRLMEDANWLPYRSTAIGNPDDEETFWWIPFNDKNESLILTLSRQYYSMKKAGQKPS